MNPDRAAGIYTEVHAPRRHANEKFQSCENAVFFDSPVISTAGRNPCFDAKEKSFLDPSHSFGMTT